MHMRLSLTIALLFPLRIVPAMADTYEVVKTSFNGQTSVYARYIQGKNERIEHLTQDGPPMPVIVNLLDRHITYALDTQSREYAERRSQGPDWILSLAQWMARPPRVHESGKTVDIYYEAIDTGERKEMFGGVARHFLLRERHVAEPGACTATYEIEKDGWYIPLNKGPRAQGGYLLYAGSVGMANCHDTVVSHGTPLPPGLPIIETSGGMRREILALSNEPLDKSLFEVPSGFTKVDFLPGFRPVSSSQRLGWEWIELERAVESWFQ